MNKKQRTKANKLKKATRPPVKRHFDEKNQPKYKIAKLSVKKNKMTKALMNKLENQDIDGLMFQQVSKMIK